jgi:hypothetical protein
MSGVTIWHKLITYWSPLRYKNGYIGCICVWSLLRKAGKPNNLPLLPNPLPFLHVTSLRSLLHAYLAAARYQTWWSVVVIYYIQLILFYRASVIPVLALWFMDPAAIDSVVRFEPIIIWHMDIVKRSKRNFDIHCPSWRVSTMCEKSNRLQATLFYVLIKRWERVVSVLLGHLHGGYLTKEYV